MSSTSIGRACPSVTLGYPQSSGSDALSIPVAAVCRAKPALPRLDPRLFALSSLLNPPHGRHLPRELTTLHTLIDPMPLIATPRMLRGRRSLTRIVLPHKWRPPRQKRTKLAITPRR